MGTVSLLSRFGFCKTAGFQRVDGDGVSFVLILDRAWMRFIGRETSSC
jgi:hypothetical protein